MKTHKLHIRTFTLHNNHCRIPRSKSIHLEDPVPYWEAATVFLVDVDKHRRCPINIIANCGREREKSTSLVLVFSSLYKRAAQSQNVARLL